MPNRIIKESALTSVSLSNLNAESERLFWRLIVVADDFGRFIATPAVVKAKCFPLKVDEFKTEMVKKWLQEIVNSKMVSIYEVAGTLYGQFINFEKHNGKRRAKYSKYPAPTPGREFVSMSQITDPILEQSKPEQNPDDSICEHMLAYADNCCSEARSETRDTRHEKARQDAGAPVDKSNSDRQEIVALAAQIGSLDKSDTRAVTTQKLCQWTISMLTVLKNEPEERSMNVARAALLKVQEKLKSGYEIKTIWGLLNTIFDAERVKYIQGPENQKYKNAPMDKAGDVLQRIAAMGAKP